MQHRPQLVVRLGLAFALTAGLVACSGDDETGPLMGALAQIPERYVEIADDGSTTEFEVRFADIARASELAGFDPPSPGRSEDAFLDDFVRLTSGSEPDLPFIAMPRGISERALVGMDAVEAETGLSLGAVETISESPGIPIPFVTMTGDLSLGGELVADGDVWIAGTGDEQEVDPEQITALRNLGRPWYFAEADGTVGFSPSRAATEAWIGDGDTLADDPWFAELAGALDEFDPYTGVLIRGAFNFAPFSAVTATSDPEEQEALVLEVGPFSHVGVAEFDDDGTPRTVVAYLFADDEAAGTAIDPLTAAWEDLRSVDADDDLSGRITGVSAETNGRVLTLVLDAPANAETRFVLALLVRRMPVFMYLPT